MSCVFRRISIGTQTPPAMKFWVCRIPLIIRKVLLSTIIGSEQRASEQNRLGTSDQGATRIKPNNISGTDSGKIQSRRQRLREMCLVSGVMAVTASESDSREIRSCQRLREMCLVSCVMAVMASESDSTEIQSWRQRLREICLVSCVH